MKKEWFRGWMVLLSLALWVGCAATTQDPSMVKPAETTREDIAADEGTAADEAPADETDAGAEVSDGDDEVLVETSWTRHKLPVPEGKTVQVDDEGRRYYIESIPKDGLVWERLDEQRVRISWGVVIWPVDEDDEAFYIREYLDRPEIQPVNPKPTEEEIEAVRASFDIEVPEVDRVRFREAGAGLPETGQWRNGFEVADMNEDGHLDIVHGTPRKSFSPPVIFLGDSKGTWTPWGEAVFPDAPFDYGDVAVADFNGDGHLDLATTSHLRGVIAMIGNGEGRFELWTEGLEFDRRGDAFSSRVIEAADWNGDGRPDLLILGEGPRLNIGVGGKSGNAHPGSQGLVVYLNQGDGTWTRHDQGTGRYEIFGDSLALGDFNQDGAVDVAASTHLQNRRSIVLMNRGDGTWDPVDVDDLRPGAYIRAVAVADFDGDGRDDLALSYMNSQLATWHTGIDVFLSPEPGSDEPWVRRPVTAVEGRIGVFALDVGDLDGDDHKDLVALTGHGDAWVYLGDGSGGFAREQSRDLPPDHGQCRGYHVALVDFDGDGRDEVITSYAGEASSSMMLLSEELKCTHAGALRAWDTLPSGVEPIETNARKK